MKALQSMPIIVENKGHSTNQNYNANGMRGTLNINPVSENQLLKKSIANQKSLAIKVTCEHTQYFVNEERKENYSRKRVLADLNALPIVNERNYLQKAGPRDIQK